MDIRIIKAQSQEYEQMVSLRISALLEPIGIPGSYIDPEKEKDDIFIGAFDEDRIIGCCILTPQIESRVQLRQMAVLPVLQGRGIGAAIIRFAEEEARKRNFKILMMHARDPVVEFYRKCGYTVEGEPFQEVGMGHRTMQKELAG